MSYSREVLYLQTKAGEGVGYIKREQNGAKRRERMVFTGFPQTGIGEYQGEISYTEEEPMTFRVTMREGRGEAPLECMGHSDNLPQILQISVGGIVIYEDLSREVVSKKREEHELQAEEMESYTQVETEVREALEEETPKEPEEIKTAKKIPQRHVVIGSKWEHICSIYPRKEPFGDGKQFVRVGLEDFVILSESCYKLAQNSFLLHGYYNYGYLVLYRGTDENYYIGTPGVFYEKEKEVAILYDFTHFECKDDEAKEGTFGYYMIPVKL